MDSSTCTLGIPDLNNPLDLFTSILIHGLAEDSDGKKVALTLKRSISFPAPPWHATFENEPQVELDLVPHPIPSCGLQLEVRIQRDPATLDYADLEGVLGSGQSSFVYSLEVLSASETTISPEGEIIITGSPNHVSFDSNSRTLTTADGKIHYTLPPLCIKVARSLHSRILAREAWFYERLDNHGLTGVIVPRNFGLFHTSLLPSNTTLSRPPPFELILPYYDYYGYPIVNRRPWVQLREDFDTSNYRGLDNPNYKDSIWHHFRKYEIPPTSVTVMLLEKAGHILTDEEYEADRSEFRDIVEDIRPTMLTRWDECYRNVVRAPDGTKICPKHERAHRWFYIDWEEATIQDNLKGQDSAIAVMCSVHEYGVWDY